MYYSLTLNQIILFLKCSKSVKKNKFDSLLLKFELEGQHFFFPCNFYMVDDYLLEKHELWNNRRGQLHYISYKVKVTF